MKKFPLSDVTIVRTEKVREVKKPVFSNEIFRVNQREFAMFAEGVGSFYACNGNEVEFAPVPGADPDWVTLFLNSQVLVALLHQRKIINFHASSFIHGGRGVMILGETGAGKSSLTASFALSGAGFLTDDLTPVIFKESIPHILPVYRAVKLRDNTVGQLNTGTARLTRAEAGTGKQYLHLEYAGVEDFTMNTVLKIGIGDCLKPEFQETTPAESFSLLRSEICSWEMLAGMPETEAEYLHQLLAIVQQVKMVKVVRPAEIGISLLHEVVREYLEGVERLKS